MPILTPPMEEECQITVEVSKQDVYQFGCILKNHIHVHSLPPVIDRPCLQDVSVLVQMCLKSMLLVSTLVSSW